MKRKLSPLFWTTLVIVLGINIIPYFWTLLSSLKKQSEIFSMSIIPKEFYFENYIQVIFESSFLRNILNSLVVSSATAVICLIIGVPAAYAFSRLKFRFRNALFMLILFITIFPGIFIISPLFDFLRGIGAIDTYFALIIPYVAYFTPLVIWILTGFFRTIHPSIEEVALMDGCGWMKMITKIFIPLSIPSIITVGIIAFTMAWNEFLFALIFTSSDSAKTIPVALSKFQGVHALDWGQTTAAAIVATIPIVIISVVLQRYIISGLTAGAVKE